MSNLKPLDWSHLNIAETPFRMYTVQADGSGKIAVDYQSKHGQPATGFETIDDAKAWAFEHYAKEMQPYIEPDTSQQIVDWFRLAKPEPDFNNYITQLGCHLEEVAEMALSIGAEDSPFYEECSTQAEHLKKLVIPDEYIQIQKDLISNVDLLDSLADQIVTALGVGYMMGFDMQGALKEVIRSNNSKFEDSKPIFNEQGKIMKGKDYSEPDLTPFLK